MTAKAKVNKKRVISLGVTTPAGRAGAIKERFLNKDLTRIAYENGMNVTRFLERLDPSKDHKDGSDAFNRVLRACGIKTRSVPEMNVAASTLGDVVRNENARHLAIEIISRAYRNAVHKPQTVRTPITGFEGAAGSFYNQFSYPAQPRANLLQPAIPLTEMIGQTTGINTNVYKPFYLQDVSKVNGRVAELAEIPAIKISQTDKTITLKKYGRRLDASYEAMRRMPIDLLTFNIQRVAVVIETEKVDKVLDIIVNGDGTANSQATSYNLTALDAGTTANNLTLRAWLAFKMKFKNPYMLTTVIGNDAPILSLMLLNVGNANIPLLMAGGLFASQSNMTPINQTLAGGERFGWLDSAPANKLVGFDRRLSVERVFEIGAQIQETDKDVKSQINSLVLSEVEGYAIIEPAANKILNLAA
jgi:hypothetical protein